MSTHSSKLDSILPRIEKLEKENRWLKWSGLFAGVVAGAAVLMGSQESSKTNQMQGERFSLKDSAGKERAHLALGHGGPVLRFLDQNGNERAGLEMAREGIMLRVLDMKGKSANRRQPRATGRGPRLVR